MKADSDNSQNLLVQKSTPLLSLWSSPLTLPEFKILDAYLARIDSHHPEKRWVRFSKGKLEALLGVQEIKIEELQKRVEHLGVMIKVQDMSDASGFRSIALFEQADCRRDEQGLWKVDLQCTTAAMRYMFNVENIGYLRYKLRSVTPLKSRYSYLLFLYLERNRFRGSWTVSVDDLRGYLGCADTYAKSFRDFNKDILKRAKKELETKTPCRFSYETVRQGKYVTDLHFILEPLPRDLEQLLHAQDAADVLPEPKRFPERGREETILTVLREACLQPDGTPEFSMTEIRQLYEVLQFVPESKLPRMEGAPVMRMRCYLRERYAELNRRNEVDEITYRFAYLLKMVKNDAESAQ